MEDKKQTKVSKLAKGELLLINIGSTSTGGRVMSTKADLAKIQLSTPACTTVGEKVALSRRIDSHWRLVGEHLVSIFPTPFPDVVVQGGDPFSEVSVSMSTNTVTHASVTTLPPYGPYSNAVSYIHCSSRGLYHCTRSLIHTLALQTILLCSTARKCPRTARG